MKTQIMAESKVILEQVRETLSEPEAWTQYAHARKKDGQDSERFDPDAVSFCLLTAIDRVSCELSDELPGDFEVAGDEVVDVVASHLSDNCRYDSAEFMPERTRLIYWNDCLNLGHEDILGVLDDVIDAAEVKPREVSDRAREVIRETRRRLENGTTRDCHGLINIVKAVSQDLYGSEGFDEKANWEALEVIADRINADGIYTPQLDFYDYGRVAVYMWTKSDGLMHETVMKVLDKIIKS